MSGITDQEQTGELSAKMRDYLAEIYRLGDRGGSDGGYISTSALADLLDVSAPAVNRMVTKLKEMALLHHEPYQGIALTERGEREALVSLRRQRIAEVFLTQVMGFGWHEVHDEAARISAAMSDPLTQRMATMAGNPTHCPHGEPIPDNAGHITLPPDILLCEAEAGQHYRITRVLTREPDRLEYLAALGLMPGVILELLHRAPFNGPIQLKLGEEYRIVGHNLAEFVRVVAAQH